MTTTNSNNLTMFAFLDLCYNKPNLKTIFWKIEYISYCYIHHGWSDFEAAKDIPKTFHLLSFLFNVYILIGSTLSFQYCGGWISVKNAKEKLLVYAFLKYEGGQIQYFHRIFYLIKIHAKLHLGIFGNLDQIQSTL